MIIIHLCGDTFNKKAAESRCNWLSKLNNLKCLELHYFWLGKNCFERFLVILMSEVFQRRYSDSSQKSLNINYVCWTLQDGEVQLLRIREEIGQLTSPILLWVISSLSMGEIRYLHQQCSRWLTNVNIIVVIFIVRERNNISELERDHHSFKLPGSGLQIFSFNFRVFNLFISSINPYITSESRIVNLYKSTMVGIYIGQYLDLSSGYSWDSYYNPWLESVPSVYFPALVF